MGVAVAAPVLGAWGAPLYAGFSWICHQRAERSWQLAGAPLAVCVRCLGLYVGALIGAVVAWKFRKEALGVALVLLGAEWLVGTTPAVVRFVLGIAVGALAVPALWTEPGRAAGRNHWRRREVRYE